MFVFGKLISGGILKYRFSSSSLKNSSRTLSTLLHQCPYHKSRRTPVKSHHELFWNLHNNPPSISSYVQCRHFTRETFAFYTSLDFPPVNVAYTLLNDIHDYTSLPWWAVIMITTFGLRSLLTLPLSVYGSYNMARVESLQPRIQKMAQQLKREVAAAMKEQKWDVPMTRYQYNTNIKRLVKELYIKENCHPLKSAVPIIPTIPTWIFMSMALRNMSGALPIKGIENVVMNPELSQEGVLWFTNLLAQDSTLVLPLIFGLCHILNIEMNSMSRLEQSRSSKFITNFLRGITFIMVPVAASVPSCICFYWVCSSFYGVFQTIITRLPKFRRFVGIPKMPSESQTPFRDMLDIAKTRYRYKRTDQSKNEKPNNE